MALVELWQQIPGFPNYEVSNMGKVRRVSENINRTTKLLKPFINEKGYLAVSLSSNGIISIIAIHELVALVFMPEQPYNKVIVHIDKNRQNNCVTNLKYVTVIEGNLINIRKLR